MELQGASGQLDDLIERVESIGFSDTDEWLRTAKDLDAVYHLLAPETKGGAKLILFLKMAALAFANEQVSERFAVVEAMVEALQAVAGRQDDRMRVAGQQLGRLLNQSPGFPGIKTLHTAGSKDQPEPRDEAQQSQSEKTTEESDAATGPPSAISLDEAAALLVQVSSEDRDDLQRIRSFFEAALKDGKPTDPRTPHLYCGLGAVNELLDGTTKDPNGTLKTIAIILDDIADLADDHLEEDIEPVAAFENSSEETMQIQTAVEMKTETDTKGNEETAEAAVQPVSAQKAEHPVEVDTRDYRPDEMDPDLIGEFVSESIELISEAETALLDLETDPGNLDSVGMVLRAFHTIKGTSGFLDLTLLSDIGHYAENLLIRVREKEIRYGGGYADLALKSLDMIKSLVMAVKEALKGQPLFKPAGYDELKAILTDPEAAGVSDTLEEEDVDLPRIGDLLVSRGVADRDTVEKVIKEHPKEPVGASLVKSNVVSVSDAGQALRAQERARGVKQQEMASVVRVSIQRLDKLIDMVGELVIAHSMVAQDTSAAGAGNHELLKKVNHTSKIVRELQDLSMSMRMIPLKATFQKMARLVRDLAKKVGKSVQLVTDGEDTEIDRNLVDIINDPLVHMIRNAVDHGIESPDERQAKGKPREGTVRLAAYHSAGRVVVEVSDDGKGLDRERILKKARERGLLADDAVLTDREIYNLVFEPGFSTAAEVTEVSGRGVGMDVVKKNIESLRGQVEILSGPGKGSIFKMSLPLTLAIIDGMVVRVGVETYVLPTICIVRIVNAKKEELHHVFGSGEMLSQQDELIPIIRMEDAFDVRSDCSESDQRLVVVIEDEGKKAGLVIDELVGRQQVVIKSLGESLKNIPGITGGAILPNGRVGLIIDIGGLMRAAYADNRFEAAVNTCAGMRA